jgi:hypothetical protein
MVDRVRVQRLRIVVADPCYATPSLPRTFREPACARKEVVHGPDLLDRQRHTERLKKRRLAHGSGADGQWYLGHKWRISSSSAFARLIQKSGCATHANRADKEFRWHN